MIEVHGSPTTLLYQGRTSDIAADSPLLKQITSSNAIFILGFGRGLVVAPTSIRFGVGRSRSDLRQHTAQARVEELPRTFGNVTSELRRLPQPACLASSHLRQRLDEVVHQLFRQCPERLRTHRL